MKEAEKQLVRRCPRLGGPVAVFYCTACAAGSRPRGELIELWGGTFDVLCYLKDTLAPEELDRLTCTKPVSKVSQLVDVIAQSKKRLTES